MNGQPDTGFVWGGPCHPMARMSRDAQRVAGAQMQASIAVFKLQHGFAPQQYHPFLLRLIEPARFRRMVSLGYDALDTDVLRVHQGLEMFLR